MKKFKVTIPEWSCDLEADNKLEVMEIASELLEIEKDLDDLFGAFKVGLLDNKKETGQASILIELKDSNIAVKHGDDKTVLLEKKNVEIGSWNRIWKTLKDLKTIE